MIGSWSLIAGVVLLLLLVAVVMKGWLAARQFEEPTRTPRELDEMETCPEGFVSKIFSRADWEFVRGLEAGRIERLFEQERKRVALVWVRQTSAMIRKVMREHAAAARQSHNLEFATEVSILSQFLTLMAVFGILSVAIQIAGPLWLGGLADFAQRLSQQVSGRAGKVAGKHERGSCPVNGKLADRGMWGESHTWTFQRKKSRWRKRTTTYCVERCRKFKATWRV
jgi:hypothetical protein